MSHAAAPIKDPRPSPTFAKYLLAMHPDPRLVAALAFTLADEKKPSCRWWSRRHAWEDTYGITAANGQDRYRQVRCKRCKLRVDAGADGTGRVWRQP